MKRLSILLGSMLIISVLAMPLSAHGPAHTKGPHIKGHWGAYSVCWAEHEKRYESVTEEQWNKLRDLDKKFYQETEPLRNEIMNLSHELYALLTGDDPEPEKAKAIQRNLSELRAQMDEKRLAHALEARTINSEFRFMREYGWRYHHHPRDYVSGKRYGPGSCWQ